MKKKVIAVIGFCGLMLSSHVRGMDPFEIVNGFTGMRRDVVLHLLYIIGLNDTQMRNVAGMCGEHLAYIRHNYFQINRCNLLTSAITRYATRHYKLNDFSREAVYTLTDTEVEHRTGKRQPKAVRVSNYLITIERIGSEERLPIDWRGSITYFLRHTFDQNNPKPDPDGLYIMRTVIKDVSRLSYSDAEGLLSLVGLNMNSSPDYLRLLENIIENGIIETCNSFYDLLPLFYDEQARYPDVAGPLDHFFSLLLWGREGNVPKNREAMTESNRRCIRIIEHRLRDLGPKRADPESVELLSRAEALEFMFDRAKELEENQESDI